MLCFVERGDQLYHNISCCLQESRKSTTLCFMCERAERYATIDTQHFTILVLSAGEEGGKNAQPPSEMVLR